MLYVFTKNKHDQSDRIFKFMAWPWLSLWVTEHHHVLACLKQWSYNKAQILYQMIKSELRICIAMWRGNVSSACILMVFETILNCREHFKNNVSKAYTISNCKQRS